MNVKDTSKQTYRDIIDEGLVGELQERVLSFIAANPNVTDKETHKRTGLDINVVCGRRNELVEMGLVCDNGKRECSITHRKVYQWKLANPIKFKPLDSDGLKDKDLEHIFKQMERATQIQIERILERAFRLKYKDQETQDAKQTKLNF
jgi:hypothetical protein